MAVLVAARPEEQGLVVELAVHKSLVGKGTQLVAAVGGAEGPAQTVAVGS